MKRLVLWVKTFLHVLRKSMGTFEYYQDIARAPIKFSIKYFFCLAFIAALIMTGGESVAIFREVEPSVRRSLENIIELYPSDMEVTIEFGEAKFNKEEPVVIKNPVYEEEQNTEKRKSIPQTLIILDANGTIDDLKDKNALMILNKKNFLTQESGEVKVFPLTNLPDMKITKETLKLGLERMQPIFRLMPYLLSSILLVVIYGYLLISKAFYLLTVACILWGFAMLVGERFKFTTLYQFAIHAATVPILIEAIVSVIPGLPNLYLLFPILNVAIAVGGLLFVTRKTTEE